MKDAGVEGASSVAAPRQAYDLRVAGHEVRVLPLLILVLH